MQCDSLVQITSIASLSALPMGSIIPARATLDQAPFTLLKDINLAPTPQCGFFCGPPLGRRTLLPIVGR
jgi:hypothetical protein